MNLFKIVLVQNNVIIQSKLNVVCITGKWSYKSVTKHPDYVQKMRGDLNSLRETFQVFSSRGCFLFWELAVDEDNQCLTKLLENLATVFNHFTINNR